MIYWNRILCHLGNRNLVTKLYFNIWLFSGIIFAILTAAKIYWTNLSDHFFVFLKEMLRFFFCSQFSLLMLAFSKIFNTQLIWRLEFRYSYFTFFWFFSMSWSSRGPWLLVNRDIEIETWCVKLVILLAVRETWIMLIRFTFIWRKILDNNTIFRRALLRWLFLILAPFLNQLHNLIPLILWHV